MNLENYDYEEKTTNQNNLSFCEIDTDVKLFLRNKQETEQSSFS